MKQVKKIKTVKKTDGRNKPNKNSLLKINEEEVKKLAERFWTNTEIAAFFNCSDKTISNRFSEIIQKGKQNGKAKLRDLQLKAAMNGNVTMLIWLGKQYLGQVDKQETEVTLPQEIIIELPPSFTNEN